MIKILLFAVFISAISAIPIIFPSISKSIIQNQKKENIPDDYCEICNYIVSNTEDKILNNTIEKSAIYIMKKNCNKLPRKNQAKCFNMIQEYSKQIIKMILKKENSNIICSKLNVCNISSNKITDCKFCKYASIRIEEFLNNNHTLFDLINFAENFCDNIPEKYDESCKNLMNIYYFEIIVRLMDRNNPVDACESINIC